MPQLKRKTLFATWKTTLDVDADVWKLNVASFQVRQRVDIYAMVVSCRLIHDMPEAIGEERVIFAGAEVSTSAKDGQDRHIYCRIPLSTACAWRSSAAGQEGMAGFAHDERALVVGNFLRPFDTVQEPGVIYVHLHMANRGNVAHSTVVMCDVTIYYTGD